MYLCVCAVCVCMSDVLRLHSASFNLISILLWMKWIRSYIDTSRLCRIHLPIRHNDNTIYLRTRKRKENKTKRHPKWSSGAYRMKLRQKEKETKRNETTHPKMYFGFCCVNLLCLPLVLSLACAIDSFDIISFFFNENSLLSYPLNCEHSVSRSRLWLFSIRPINDWRVSVYLRRIYQRIRWADEDWGGRWGREIFIEDFVSVFYHFEWKNEKKRVQCGVPVHWPAHVYCTIYYIVLIGCVNRILPVYSVMSIHTYSFMWCVYPCVAKQILLLTV